MPGWNAQPVYLPSPSAQFRLAALVWDSGALQEAFARSLPQECAALNGPGRTALLLAMHPAVPGRVVVGCLRPPELDAPSAEADEVPVPSAIDLPRDPVLAAIAIRQRLLPARAHALWAARSIALRRAVTMIEIAGDSWDAISDSLCDQDGWPLDPEEYGSRKVVRDLDAWNGVQLYLDHGPTVLATVRQVMTSSDQHLPELRKELRRLEQLDSALDEAAQLRQRWSIVHDFLDEHAPSQPRLRLRATESTAADGWDSACTIAMVGRSLARVAERLAFRVEEASTTAALPRTLTAVQELPGDVLGDVRDGGDGRPIGVAGQTADHCATAGTASTPEAGPTRSWAALSHANQPVHGLASPAAAVLGDPGAAPQRRTR